eukprot:TRINITY_DN23811_c0_g1_i1.p1 TRINITY_DN23811_c0_g1~~TRINITY_DN23811_c0_g1_i1.p1  ORF type:complete len:469 (-),score=60.86 TRINITY_DN23811_c0_g1_i1:130-1464(-)
MAPTAAAGPALPRVLQGIATAYTRVWKSALRPPRAVPSPECAGRCCWGVRRGTDEPTLYERLEFSLVSDRGHTLRCSYFTPAEGPNAKTTPRPCCVYLPGMSGCRFDVVKLLPFLLRYDITVCSVDVSGCGESDGEYVSFGHHEQQDLRVVLAHIRNFPTVTSVGLWGWSMGAVTAILRASEDDSIAACVLDSAFADLSTVFHEVMDTTMPMMPQMLVSLGVMVVKHEAKARANFDPAEVRPIDRAPLASCPVLFGVAKGDTITRPAHTEELYRRWGGSKRVIHFEGDHNSDRPSFFLREAAKFLWKQFELRAIADGHPFTDTPEADSVFLVEPGGAFHQSMGDHDAFSIPKGVAFRRPSSDHGAAANLAGCQLNLSEGKAGLMKTEVGTGFVTKDHRTELITDWELGSNSPVDNPHRQATDSLPSTALLETSDGFSSHTTIFI